MVQVRGFSPNRRGVEFEAMTPKELRSEEFPRYPLRLSKQLKNPGWEMWMLVVYTWMSQEVRVHGY